jgi:hypothetical protein
VLVDELVPVPRVYPVPAQVFLQVHGFVDVMSELPLGQE